MLNAGEKITVEGTTHYDGTYDLAAVTTDGLLAVTAAYEDESFDGSPLAIPHFYSHSFPLPRRQPTLCFEKYLDYEPGAAKMPYRRFHFCKVNGFNFSLGGDDELKFTFDFTVGREASSATPLTADYTDLPAVVMDTIEGSIFVAGQRRGDVETASLTNSFGITAKAAVGDRGQYSRMPEGDPDSKCTLEVFLEQDDLQALADSRATVPLTLVLCASTGEQLNVIYPETELDAEGAAITGKDGLMQSFTVMPFVDKSVTMIQFALVNRVPSYA